MAYNSYYPATYQPYNYQAYPQVYQPVQQPVTQQPSYQQTAQTSGQNSQSGIIWVRNQNEAAMFPIAPNTALALWDSGNPVIYLKQADASGKPSMKIYDLVERTEASQESTEEKDGKRIDYATKDDLGAVVGVVKDFDKAIGSLKSEIETMKGDLYGIAGKKKTATAKKSEDE